MKKESQPDLNFTIAINGNLQKNDNISEITGNPITDLISLQFLMTPRILYLSLKNQQSLPYIFHLTLMPKLISPFLENYVFEWKSLNNTKTVFFIFSNFNILERTFLMKFRWDILI